MDDVTKLDDKQLLINYALAKKELSVISSALKDMEKEMQRRAEMEMEKRRA